MIKEEKLGQTLSIKKYIGIMGIDASPELINDNKAYQWCIFGLSQ